jgi:alpha,alpha-trehalase
MLPPGEAYRNSVRLSDGTLLNRYWDARDAPRDESYKEDVETAAGSGRPPGLVYRNLRAAAESGWDFSSRWLTDGKSLATVRTLSILPVDLNCLLVHLEETLSKAYGAQGDAAQAAAYHHRAQRRSEAIRRLMWDARDGVFSDSLWETGELTGAVTAATLYPLFLRIATEGHARVVAANVERKLLDVGGLATTLIESGQQWDAPNGWAPLQWIAVVGLRNYGFDQLDMKSRSAGCARTSPATGATRNSSKSTTSRHPAATRAAAANIRRRSASAGPTASWWR